MERLNAMETNAVLNGTEWLAVGNSTDTGFDLVQLDKVNDGSDDLDLFATTDSLPVVQVERVAAGIKFILATAERDSAFRTLVIQTSQAVDEAVKIAA